VVIVCGFDSHLDHKTDQVADAVHRIGLTLPYLLVGQLTETVCDLIHAFRQGSAGGSGAGSSKLVSG
jgi:hypothetical protein